MAYVATIGFFDGMHLGHRYLLQELLSLSSNYALTPLVITFQQHPQAVLHPNDIPPLLMTPQERIEAIHAQGIEHIKILDFAAVQKWTRRQFIAYLRHELKVDILLMGYNHHFGCDGNTDFPNYEQTAKQEHILLLQAKPYINANVYVSSTKIRNLLLNHAVEQANTLLVEPYTLTGKVTHGRQIGRSIGFPTANLQPLDKDKLIPAHGVYAVVVEIDTQHYKGILNIGNNPTVGGQAQTLEVYIHNFEGDLYDQLLTVHFLHFLREEQRFSSLEDLRKQILSDCSKAWNEPDTDESHTSNKIP